MEAPAKKRPSDRVALVEDDADQRKIYDIWLTDAGYTVTQFERGADLMSQYRSQRFELLILDWELPDMNGLNLLRVIRSRHGDNVPVVFLTARSDATDIIAALTTGADDYVAKPADEHTFLARCRAVLRRSRLERANDEGMEFPPYRFDIDQAALLLNDEPVDLSDKEVALAHYLFTNAGRTVSREELLAAVWAKPSAIETRTVDVHVSRLRKKLKLEENQWALKTVYQLGYQLQNLAEG